MLGHISGCTRFFRWRIVCSAQRWAQEYLEGWALADSDHLHGPRRSYCCWKPLSVSMALAGSLGHADGPDSYSWRFHRRRNDSRRGRRPKDHLSREPRRELRGLEMFRTRLAG